MSYSNYSDELIENPSSRCACVLVLDTSYSMSGAPIQQLNAGVKEFINAVNRDEIAACAVDLAVISAGERVEAILPFTTVRNVDFCKDLSANGLTPIGGAVSLAVDMLENRKNEYKRTGVAYYQPWLVIISDGEPTDTWQPIANMVRNLSAQRKLVSLPIGVDNANMAILGAFTSKQPIRLNGLEFKKFFEWLSASMSRVSASNSTTAQTTLPPINSWGSI